jgi:hypothetical protein
MNEVARLVGFFESMAMENHERARIRAEALRQQRKAQDKRRPKAERRKRKQVKASKRKNR